MPYFDCTTAGQTVRYHALFISAYGFFGSIDKHKLNTFGLRDLLTSLQSPSNVDGLYYRRTDCTVSRSLYLPRTFAFGLFGSIDNKLTNFWPPRSPYLTPVDI